ncbi:hypothetical protein LTR47_006674 [Exophiala xenobiotica]|nr:hypothetical protein LTR47_006674 [Exophiala xenobiotica]KAK5244550.1 hypothetical protein LTS06_009885 [Exophiala xenobiotica]KAK5363659.1 hypothetical protein LTR11_009087 [Exophiala xenobiotica]KAK5365024.1 hypothetical protein LTS03_009084 [Exophiala xenobiotica]
MKAPFPLLLPHSPSVSEENSPAPACSSGLRRMPTSCNGLRGLAHQQAGSPMTPLLPSPITGELKVEERSYFKFHNPRNQSRCSDDGSIDNLQILSYYCSNEKSDSEGEQHSLFGPADDDSHDVEESTASESSPVTPIDQGCRDVLCADESGWLANTTSHDERRRRFKARYYQVVEHPYIDLQNEHGEDPVMVATVLIGPGKPKIIQIQRPPSSQSRLASPTELPSVPSTPVHAPIEVSAFSPYDTPGDMPEIDSCLNEAAHADAPEPALMSLRPSLLPEPLTLPARTFSSRSDSSMIGATLRRLHSLTDPFGMSPRRSRSSRASISADPKWTIRHGFAVPESSLHLSPTNNVATWSRCCKMERVLKAVTRAIDNFPDGMLRLDSVPILEIRSPQVADQIYIDALQRIFPTAPTLLLSALTAWILVDAYFTRLEEQFTPMERYWAHAAESNESLYRIPDKARVMLGIGIPDARSIRLNEYGLRMRAAAIHASIGVIGKRLIEALRGLWDDDIWRSLKVLVEVIEASPQPW